VAALSYIVTAVGAYLLGSIPTGFLAAKAKGIDIRTVGSGNIGATNVFRILGNAAGVFVLVVDALKGYAAAAWFCDLMAQQFPVPEGQLLALRIVAGCAAVVGHNYTCWLYFKGGKGMATSAGVMAAWVPWALIISAALWLVVFLATRFVSLSSIAAAVTLPVATWFTSRDVTLLIVTGSLAVLAIYKHKSNMRRLLHGTEPRVRLKRKEVTS
jgi:acyl phosphate:glycerol-3-phosphate acyltransferase